MSIVSRQEWERIGRANGWLDPAHDGAGAPRQRLRSGLELNAARVAAKDAVDFLVECAHQEGVLAERQCIVAYLRAQKGPEQMTSIVQIVADAIDCGDHTQSLCSRKGRSAQLSRPRDCWRVKALCARIPQGPDKDENSHLT